MEKGKLAKWLKKEGDTVKSGDVIAEIETDKATMEVEAVDEGTLGKILVPEGTEDVAVNTPIAVHARRRRGRRPRSTAGAAPRGEAAAAPREVRSRAPRRAGAEQPTTPARAGSASQPPPKPQAQPEPEVPGRHRDGDA